MKELRIFFIIVMLAVLIAIPLRWENLGTIDYHREAITLGANNGTLEKYCHVKFKVDRFANQGWVIVCIQQGTAGFPFDFESRIIERPISPGFDTKAQAHSIWDASYIGAWRKRKAINISMFAAFWLSCILLLASFPYERWRLKKREG